MNRQSTLQKTTKNEKKIQKDIDILKRFIILFCENNHKTDKKELVNTAGFLGEYIKDGEVSLCNDCKKLLLYAGSKLVSCPYDPKPQCKKCETHCYKAPYRQHIKQVMKYSGLYSLMQRKLDVLGKYLF